MEDETCIFCRIISGEIPSKTVYTDTQCIGFRDVNPQAPVHLLVIPRKHFASPLEAEEADEKLIGHLHRVAAELARQHHITEGFRIVLNTGPGSGQTVFHLHLHVLGGRPMRWPPG
ncbi:MAG: histidine triad nucleotide-binding protein [Acidobacteria bacterium]|nr:histidine triad nucleotide-binding protein [Acidobacteriota bacterium]